MIKKILIVLVIILVVFVVIVERLTAPESSCIRVCCIGVAVR